MGKSQKKIKDTKTIDLFANDLEEHDEENKLGGRYGTCYAAMAVALKIIKSTHGLTVSQIAEALGGVHPKTVRRHINKMMELFPIRPEEGDNKIVVYKVDEAWKKGVVPSEEMFSYLEYIGFLHLNDLLSPLKGTNVRHPLQLAIDKINKNLPDQTRKNFERLRKTFKSTNIGFKDYESKHDIINLLQNAIQQQRVVNINYHSFNSKTHRNREVEPHKFEVAEGSIYLIASEAGTPKTKKFKVDRIDSAELLEKEFKKLATEGDEISSKTFGVYSGDTEQKIIVVFDADTAPFIREREYAPDQKIEDIKDGSIKVSWVVNHTAELRSWLMGFCEHVEVLEPIELRAEIKRDLLKMMRVYQMNANLANITKEDVIAAVAKKHHPKTKRTYVKSREAEQENQRSLRLRKG